MHPIAVFFLLLAFFVSSGSLVACFITLRAVERRRRWHQRRSSAAIEVLLTAGTFAGVDVIEELLYPAPGANVKHPCTAPPPPPPARLRDGRSRHALALQDWYRGDNYMFQRTFEPPRTPNGWCGHLCELVCLWWEVHQGRAKLYPGEEEDCMLAPTGYSSRERMEEVIPSNSHRGPRRRQSSHDIPQAWGEAGTGSLSRDNCHRQRSPLPRQLIVPGGRRLASHSQRHHAYQPARTEDPGRPSASTADPNTVAIEFDTASNGSRGGRVPSPVGSPLSTEPTSPRAPNTSSPDPNAEEGIMGIPIIVRVRRLRRLPRHTIEVTMGDRTYRIRCRRFTFIPAADEVPEQPSPYTASRYLQLDGVTPAPLPIDDSSTDTDADADVDTDDGDLQDLVARRYDTLQGSGCRGTRLAAPVLSSAVTTAAGLPSAFTSRHGSRRLSPPPSPSITFTSRRTPSVPSWEQTIGVATPLTAMGYRPSRRAVPPQRRPPTPPIPMPSTQYSTEELRIVAGNAVASRLGSSELPTPQKSDDFNLHPPTLTRMNAVLLSERRGVPLAPQQEAGISPVQRRPPRRRSTRERGEGGGATEAREWLRSSASSSALRHSSSPNRTWEWLAGSGPRGVEVNASAEISGSESFVSTWGSASRLHSPLLGGRTSMPNCDAPVRGR